MVRSKGSETEFSTDAALRGVKRTMLDQAGRRNDSAPVGVGAASGRTARGCKHSGSFIRKVAGERMRVLKRGRLRHES